MSCHIECKAQSLRERKDQKSKSEAQSSREQSIENARAEHKAWGSDVTENASSLYQDVDTLALQIPSVPFQERKSCIKLKPTVQKWSNLMQNVIKTAQIWYKTAILIMVWIWNIPIGLCHLVLYCHRYINSCILILLTYCLHFGRIQGASNWDQQ